MVSVPNPQSKRSMIRGSSKGWVLHDPSSLEAIDRSGQINTKQLTDSLISSHFFLLPLCECLRTDRAGVCWDLRSLHARETRYSERDTRRECKWFLCVYIAANDLNMWTKRRHWVISFTVSTALNSSRLNRMCFTHNHFPPFILYLPLSRSSSRCSFSVVIYCRRYWWVSCFKAIRTKSADRVQWRKSVCDPRVIQERWHLSDL